jgi:4-hydroxybenzoate polyprenyltransferase
MTTIKKYLSLVKFSHTIFAMPFALIGFFLGIKALERIPWIKIYQFRDLSAAEKTKIFFQNQWWIFILVILCMIFARSAAMAYNRYLDKNFDAMNPRTAIREIPAGVIKAKNALFFVGLNCILFIICTYFINSICFYLSPVALFVVLFYSYTKRFTALCHLVLGVGLSLAPIGAYLAVTGQFALLPVLFSFAVLFWVSGFDIIYALQDEEFDRSNELHSIPAALGRSKALIVSNLLHVLAAACVIIAGFYGNFGLWYWIGVVFFCGLLAYQHLLVKPNDLSKVNMAFFTTNGIASVVFAIFVIVDLFVSS